jgi:imidazolonepropionase
MQVNDSFISDYAPSAGTLHLWRNVRLATMNPMMPGIGEILDAALAVKDGRIVYAGNESGLPAEFTQTSTIIDCKGRWITPGLIDCHTHLVHAGDRSREFELRLAGATYEQIGRSGGGILSSVKLLRETSEETLVRHH